MVKYKVSIISAIYNSQRYLVECLESLVNQTLINQELRNQVSENIEIILINDASPDNSLEILQDYKKKYPKLIKLINLTENIGGGGALNKGLEVAQGEYISFVDPDDHVDVNMCEKLYNLAKQDDADIVQFNYLMYFEQGYKKSSKKRDVVFPGIPVDFFEHNIMKPECKKECLSMGMGIGPIWSRLYKKSLWASLKYPKNNLYFDFPIVFMPVILAEKVIRFDETLYFYRVREGSASTNKDKKSSLGDHLDGLLHMLDQSISLGVYKDYQELIITRVMLWFKLRVLLPFFKDRYFYKSNADIDKFLLAIESHIKAFELAYPGYQNKLVAGLDIKSQRKLKLLFAYPRFLKCWLDLKFGAKNLWHKLLWWS